MNKNRLIFVGENCDEASFDWDDIVDFQIDGAGTTLVKDDEFSLHKFNSFTGALIEVDKNGNKRHHVFGVVPTEIDEFKWISENSIAQIILETASGVRTYHLKENQNAHVSVIGGNLCIKIY